VIWGDFLEFDEAKDKLKQGYVNYGFELLDETEDRLRMRYKGNTYLITRDDIQEFANFEDRRSG
jgi:hypothetical protein